MRIVPSVVVVVGLAAGLALTARAPGCVGPHARAAAPPAPQAVAPAPVVDVRASPLGAGFVRGVNHAHIHRRGHGYGSPPSAAEMAELQRFGVEWLALTPFAFQTTATSSTIVGYGDDAASLTSRVAQDRSLTDDDIVAEVAAAHARGMKAVLKPHIWGGDFWGGGEWQGTIRQTTPADRAAWWRAWRGFVLHYARVAAASKADAYCIGTELVLQTKGRDDEWRQLARDVRAVYTGPLTYAAHWDQEVEQIGFWDALDAVGISAYFPLNAPDGASVDELVHAWAPHEARLGAIAARTGKPIVFMELGFRAATGSFRTPWAYEGGVLDEATQARAYEATFRALSRQPWWRGAFLWKTFTDPQMADEGGDGASFSFRGKAAERVIQAWYGGARR